jgi:hypothetical protein
LPDLFDRLQEEIEASATDPNPVAAADGVYLDQCGWWRLTAKAPGGRRQQVCL